MTRAAPHPSDLLRIAMTVPIDSALPEKTRHEMEAGRQRIMRNLRASVAETGAEELQRRFTKRSVPTSDLRFIEGENRWAVDVVVHTAAGTIMQFSDELLEFPSDRLIAEISLVV